MVACIAGSTLYYDGVAIAMNYNFRLATAEVTPTSTWEWIYAYGACRPINVWPLRKCLLFLKSCKYRVENT